MSAAKKRPRTATAARRKTATKRPARSSKAAGRPAAGVPKARRARALFEQYLESVSGQTMEAYPQLVRDLIRGKSGVYALYHGKRLYYVGLASNLMGRLKSHLRDRHKGLWDHFSVYLTSRNDGAHIRELEALLLRIVAPTGNRVGGRLRQATDLRRSLQQDMREQDDARRIMLLGGASGARRSRTSRRKSTGTKLAKGATALSALITRRVALQATYKGVVYRATLRKDGQVSVGRTLFASPTGAAKSIVKRRINGWTFWRYRDGGLWVRLTTLRH